MKKEPKMKSEKMYREEKYQEDISSPEACFSQEYNQAPLRYIERENKRSERSAKQVKKQEYKGRYQ